VKKQKKPHRPCSSKRKELYKVNNWSEYNRSLKLRGSLKIWVPYKILQHWYHEGKQKRGSPLDYSDECIEFFLTIKAVYGLGYRQTEGFIESVFSMRKINLPVPSYSAVCKRSATINVRQQQGYTKDNHRDRKGRKTSADSTGLKVYGEGEWKVRKHGWSKHRTWQKLHLVIDPDDKMILGNKLTTNSVDDAAVVPCLLDQIRDYVTEFSGDGAYDRHKVYEVLSEKKIKAIIPPRKGARIKKHGNKKDSMNPRDRNIRMIRQYGRKNWKKKIGYHKRSITETTMYRYKTIIGDKLYSRTFERQDTETEIACKILNIMTKNGMPKSRKVTKNHKKN
jgi:hypothetical protein